MAGASDRNEERHGDGPDKGERARRDLRQDKPGSLPTGVRASRRDHLRGHSREAAPYEEAPAEGHLAPGSDE